MAHRFGAHRACVAVVAIACGGRVAPAPVAAVRDGISIALYGDGAGAALVDERRWLDLAGDAFVVDLLAPDVALAQLTIEPLAGGPFELGSCVRAAAASVRCAVRARRGRHLVRLLYPIPPLEVNVHHDIAMSEPDRARISTRFTVTMPSWHGRAELTVLQGVPGAGAPPRERARGSAAIDGRIVVLEAGPQEVPARLRRTYVGEDSPDGDLAAGRPRPGGPSHPTVWVWLELGRVALAPGSYRALVTLEDEGTNQAYVHRREDRVDGVRLRLWADDRLRGERELRTASPHDAAITEWFSVTVSNTGGKAREVWVEETVRASRHLTVAHAWPSLPVIRDGRLRLKLVVPPGKRQRGGYQIDYDL